MFWMKLRSQIVPLLLVFLFTLAACGTEAPAGDDANDAAQTPGDVSLKDLPDDTAEDDNSDSVPEDDTTDETPGETGDVEDAEPLAREDYSFDTSLLSYLGQPSADVAAALDATGEWEYVYDENGTPNPRPNRIEPAVVDGAEYDYYVRLNSSAEAWGISFERSISVTAETKTDELQKVYDLLVSELGEPEELTGAHSVGEALTEEFANRTSYTEWWILDEDYEMAFDPGLDMALTCHLTVRYESPGLTIGIHYALYPPSGLYEIARYRESGVAQPPV